VFGAESDSILSIIVNAFMGLPVRNAMNLQMSVRSLWAVPLSRSFSISIIATDFTFCVALSVLSSLSGFESFSLCGVAAWRKSLILFSKFPQISSGYCLEYRA